MSFNWENMDKFQGLFEEFKEEFFIPKYNRDHGKSKYSEQVFMRFIEKLAPQTKCDRHFKLEITLENSSKRIGKDIDIYFETLNSVFLVEIKKNIDLVEKDLFKWFLMKNCGWEQRNNQNPNGKKYKKVELIWEEKPQSDDCQYLRLLKYAERQNWIDRYIYLTTDQERFIEQLKGLEELINQN